MHGRELEVDGGRAFKLWTKSQIFVMIHLWEV